MRVAYSIGKSGMRDDSFIDLSGSTEQCRMRERLAAVSIVPTRARVPQDRFRNQRSGSEKQRLVEKVQE